MNTAQLTDRAQAVIAASDEYTAPIFRAPSVGGSGMDEDQIYTLDRAADLLEGYAEFIRSDPMDTELERHPYLPELDETAKELRALSIAATAATGETS